MDGSLYPSQTGGIGIVVRDMNGRFLKAAGFQVEHWDSTFVEFMAIQKIWDIMERWMFEYKDVIIESDNSANILYAEAENEYGLLEGLTGCCPRP